MGELKRSERFRSLFRAWLVPSYTFGENDIFLQLPNKKGSMLRKIQVEALKINQIRLLRMQSTVVLVSVRQYTSEKACSTIFSVFFRFGVR
jgi:hypothetical protein